MFEGEMSEIIIKTSVPQSFVKNMDAQLLIRCKNCKYEDCGSCLREVRARKISPDWYCAGGELREKNVKYHLSCNFCGYDWWSSDAFPKSCPHCGMKRDKKHLQFVSGLRIET